MAPEKIVLWILVAFITLFLIIGIFYLIIQPGRPPVDPSTFTSKYIELAIWGLTTPSNDGSRNFCNGYTFPASTDYNECVNGTCKGIPGIPSTNPDVLAQLKPEVIVGCIDQDQLVLFQGTHTCVQPVPPPPDAVSGEVDGVPVSFCTESDGTPAEVGDSEIIYTDNGTIVNSDGSFTQLTCNSTPCGGNLSLYAVNYLVNDDSAAENGILCLVGNNGQVDVTTCDISDVNQITRVSRNNSNDLNQNQGNVTQASNRNGYYANIYYRNALSYLNVDGDNIVLNSDASLNWLLLPQQTGDCNTYSGTCQSPQQTLDISGITQDQVQALFGDTSGETIDNIIAAGLRSIQLSSNYDSVVLLPFVAGSISDSGEDNFQRATTQYIDYTLYNQIIFGDTPTSFGS